MFFGKEQMENVAATGKTEGRRARGRQKLTFTSSFSQWMKISAKELIRIAQYRALRKTMATNVLAEEGTYRGGGETNHTSVQLPYSGCLRSYHNNGLSEQWTVKKSIAYQI